MHKLSVLVIATILAPVALADDSQSTTPKVRTKGQSTTKPGTAFKGQVVDNMSFEQLQKQMLASQEARLPFMEKEIEMRIRTPLKVLGDPESSALLARYIHSLYENLIKEGSSKEDALQIASRVPFPPSTSAPIY